MGKHHFEMKYQIKVFIGAADIRFEIRMQFCYSIVLLTFFADYDAADSKDQKLSHDQPIKADIVEASASQRCSSTRMERVDGVLR